jgi:1,4-dihydroxy-2-naphthoate octaprenyltransferase
MFKKSSWEHLRIPFSYYLMPVFWFALSFAPETPVAKVFAIGIILHLFLYPSSNGYNSYFDKDEKSIGGLKNPKKVTIGLYYLSLLFFGLALLPALFYGRAFFVLVLVYGLVSMAYSHPSVRLKKYPLISWLTAGFFQGAFTFGMCIAGFKGSGFSGLLEWNILLPALLTTLLLLGSYPLTQVYQHEEDHRRGDITLSLKLGILGTFYFTSIWFLISGMAFVYYFFASGAGWAVWWFLGCTSPLVVYFFYWFSLVQKEPQKYASHKMAMLMNKISASTLNFFFIIYYLAQ